MHYSSIAGRLDFPPTAIVLSAASAAVGPLRNTADKRLCLVPVRRGGRLFRLMAGKGHVSVNLAVDGFACQDCSPQVFDFLHSRKQLELLFREELKSMAVRAIRFLQAGDCHVSLKQKQLI